MRLALLAVLACAPARAQPESCKGLAVQKVTQFSTYAHNRFAGAESWESRKVDWKVATVNVIVDRAPHIARAALEACPGITVKTVSPLDPKRQTSVVTVMVASFAPLTRLAQLPAVHSISVRDRRRMRQFDFEDIQF